MKESRIEDLKRLNALFNKVLNSTGQIVEQGEGSNSGLQMQFRVRWKKYN